MKLVDDMHIQQPLHGRREHPPSNRHETRGANKRKGKEKALRVSNHNRSFCTEPGPAWGNWKTTGHSMPADAGAITDGAQEEEEELYTQVSSGNHDGI